MENQICAICGQPMKYINAGVSRTTGKPYNGFWACNDRTHKQPKAPQNTYPVQTQPAVYQNPVYKTTTGQIGVNLTAQAPAKEVDWDRISFGKCKTLFLVEAYKLGKDPDVAEADAEDWAGRAIRKLGKVEMKDYGQGETLTEIPF